VKTIKGMAYMVLHTKTINEIQSGGWTGHLVPMNKLRKRTPNMHVYAGILELSLNERDTKMRTGLIWLRKGTRGALL
jgi:hypothetical protein